MRLGGAFDMRAGALEDIRAESLSEIETIMRRIRPNLNDVTKSRFDDEWKKYQDLQIFGVEMQDTETGREFTTHDDCKKGLTDCLKELQKIARE